MDRTFLCQEAKKSLSEARLKSYQQPGDVDEFNAIARYLWNTSLCEALYPSLQCFEVVLRNAMHDSLAGYYRPDWLQEEHLFRRGEWDRILDAEGSLVAQGKVLEGQEFKPERLVAELALGFWTGLFAHHYDKSVAIPVMKRGLRGFPDTLRTRRALYEKFERVRHLRNRVFHHEPIWHWEDLPERHSELVAYIGYMNLTNQKMNTLLDRFNTVHATGWKPFRTRIGDTILTPSPTLVNG